MPSRRISLFCGAAALAAALSASPAAARWLEDCSRATPPSRPPTGTIQGRPFRTDRAEILTMKPRKGVGHRTFVLNLRQVKGPIAEAEVTITLITPLRAGLDGRSFVVGPGGPFRMPGLIREGNTRYPPVQGISLKVKPAGKTAMKSEAVGNKKYTMRLQFNRTAGKKLSGKLYFCMRDARRTWVAGSFTAAVR
jgi:hypothetical protein